jgi:hypothetical protein
MDASRASQPIPVKSSRLTNDEPFRFLDLPPELRLMVYEQLCPKVTHHELIFQESTLVYTTLPGINILPTSRQVNSEAHRIFDRKLSTIKESLVRLMIQELNEWDYPLQDFLIASAIENTMPYPRDLRDIAVNSSETPRRYRFDPQTTIIPKQVCIARYNPTRARNQSRCTLREAWKLHERLEQAIAAPLDKFLKIDYRLVVLSEKDQTHYERVESFRKDPQFRARCAAQWGVSVSIFECFGDGKPIKLADCEQDWVEGAR